MKEGLSIIAALLAIMVLVFSVTASAAEDAEAQLVMASNTTCTLCEFAMSILQGVVSENTTEEELIKLLDTFCDRMPSTIEQECKEFVTNYGAAIIQLVSQKIDPQLICRELKLCPHTSDVKSHQKARKTLTTVH